MTQKWPTALIEEWRGQFPVALRWNYLNHAAVAPISRSCFEAMKTLIEDVKLNGVVNFSDWYRTHDSLRKSAANLVGCRADQVAVAKNTSEGISFVAQGYDWHSGDVVVTSSSEFPANTYPWMSLEPRGVEIRWVEEIDGRINLERVLESIDSRTKIVSLSSVEFSSGFRNNLEAIGKVCQERDILWVVDGIQSLGALPMQMEAWGIDVVAADAHKWLLGPEGVALFCVSDRALDRIEVKEVGWSSVINRGRYLEYDFTLQPDARRFECGTPTTVGLYGLLAALELVNAVGIETISERIKHLGDFACQKADECGLTLFSARESELWSGIISLSVVSSASKIARELQQQGIVVAPRDGRIRLSPHYYNTEDEISHAITSISELDNAQEMA